MYAALRTDRNFCPYFKNLFEAVSRPPGWPWTWYLAEGGQELDPPASLHLSNSRITPSAGIYRHVTPHLFYYFFWTGLYHKPKGRARTEVIVLAHFSEYWGFRYVPPAWPLPSLAFLDTRSHSDLGNLAASASWMLGLQVWATAPAAFVSLHLGSKSMWIYTRHLWNTQFTDIFLLCVIVSVS